MGDLGFELHFDTDLAATVDVIDRLQEALFDLAPAFCTRLRVMEYERDPTAVTVDPTTPGALHAVVVDKGTSRGAVFDRLSAASPPKFPRRFGHVLVRGAAPSTFLGIGFDEEVPARRSGDTWLFSNSITGRVGAKRIGKLSPQAWVHRLLTRLAAHPDLLWAMACTDDEFSYRNMHHDDQGQWALGRDVRLSLPGVYWLNIFGPRYAAAIGHDRLASIPAEEVARVGDAVVVQLYGGPEDWSTDEGKARHRGAVTHLGSTFFYDRENPDAETVAPDFGLAALEEGGSLRVTTEDGERFTRLRDGD